MFLTYSESYNWQLMQVISWQHNYSTSIYYLNTKTLDKRVENYKNVNISGKKSSVQHNSPDKVVSRKICKMSRHFFLKNNKMSRKKLKKKDKHILTQDYHTLDCFLVFSMFARSILIESLISLLPLFCYNMQQALQMQQSTAHGYIIAI